MGIVLLALLGLLMSSGSGYIAETSSPTYYMGGGAAGVGEGNSPPTMMYADGFGEEYTWGGAEAEELVEQPHVIPVPEEAQAGDFMIVYIEAIQAVMEWEGHPLEVSDGFEVLHYFDGTSGEGFVTDSLVIAKQLDGTEESVTLTLWISGSNGNPLWQPTTVSTGIVVWRGYGGGVAYGPQTSLSWPWEGGAQVVLLDGNQIGYTLIVDVPADAPTGSGDGVQIRTDYQNSSPAPFSGAYAVAFQGSTGGDFDGVDLGWSFVGVVMAFDEEGNRTTWAVWDEGWSEVFKLDADEDGVYVEYTGDYGEYDGDQHAAGVAKFAPDGTLIWRWIGGEDMAGGEAIRLDRSAGQVIVSSDFMFVLGSDDGNVRWSWDPGGYGVFGGFVPAPDGRVWVAASNPSDDPVLLLVGPGGIEGEWSVATVFDAGYYLLPSDDLNTFYVWVPGGGGNETVYRFDADGSSSPVVTLVLDVATVEEVDVMSVDPETREFFATMGHPFDPPETRQAWAWNADGSYKWGPVYHGVEDSNGQNQNLARDGVYMVFGFDDGSVDPQPDYMHAIAVLDQATGEILLNERVADGGAGGDFSGGAIGGSDTAVLYGQ